MTFYGRRSFVAACLTALVSSRLGGALSLASRSGSDEGMPFGGFLPAIDPDSAAALGHEFLRAYPEESGPADLARSIAEHPSIGAPLSDRTSRLLPDAIALDFERGDVVNVAGWMLARTEARVCALLATAIKPHSVI